MKIDRILMKIFGCISTAAFVGFALMPRTAGASHPTIGLGTAESFAVLGGQTVTNTGPTVVNGDVGVSPGTAVTGFSSAPTDGKVNNGSIYAGPSSLAASAQSDLTIAYDDAAGRACSPAKNLTGTDLGGLTLTPGVYCFSSTAQLTGVLTLDAEGDPSAVFIFQVGSGLTTATDSKVMLTNGAEACNVFWKVGSSATLNTTTSFKGSILALTSIFSRNATTVEGRLLARNGEVTLDTNTITRPICSHAGPQSPWPTLGTPTGGTTTGGTTGGTTTGGTTGGTTTGGTASNTTSGRQGTGETPDSNLPRTGERYPTAPTLALATFMILTGLLYNFLGSSSSPMALAVRGYQPKHRARPWRRT